MPVPERTARQTRPKFAQTPLSRGLERGDELLCLPVSSPTSSRLDAGNHPGGDARVACRGVQFIVAQQRLDDSNIGAALQKVGREAVPAYVSTRHRRRIPYVASRALCRVPVTGLCNTGIGKLRIAALRDPPVDAAWFCQRYKLYQKVRDS